MQPKQTFLLRALVGYPVGMQSDTKTYRVYMPWRNTIILTRTADIKPPNKDALPNIATLLDGITRQKKN